MFVVCLNAPSIFGQKMQPYSGQQGVCMMRLGKTHRQLTNRGSTAHQLAPAAKPLPFRDEWHTIALLVYGQVAPVAEDNCIRVFAIAVVANVTLRILLFSQASRFAIYSGCRTGAGTVGLRGSRVWFRNTYKL
jgi:hypothetical protein